MNKSIRCELEKQRNPLNKGVSRNCGAASVDLSTELIRQIGHRKEIESWRFER